MTVPEKQEKTVEKINFENYDEFEDFPAQPWQESEEDLKKIPVWEDTWEDDDSVPDFAAQFKKEQEAKKAGVAPMKQ